MIIMEIPEVPFYGYLVAGFVIGAYLHNKHFHHAIHWIIIGILQGIVWFLDKTDSYQRPKNKEIQQSKSPTKKEDIIPITFNHHQHDEPTEEISVEEFKEWMNTNKQAGRRVKIF